MANRTLYLGGTFNPVHIGHTRLALECHLHTGAEVVFVPCADPPHKAAPVIPANHRLAMLRLAIEDLNISVADDPSSEVQSPENYSFSIGIKPQTTAQTVTVAPNDTCCPEATTEVEL